LPGGACKTAKKRLPKDTSKKTVKVQHLTHNLIKSLANPTLNIENDTAEPMKFVVMAIGTACALFILGLPEATANHVTSAR
jgi:hypothetical protein